MLVTTFGDCKGMIGLALHTTYVEMMYVKLFEVCLSKKISSKGTLRTVEQKIKRRSKGRFFGEPRSFSTQFAIVSFILILMFMLAYLVMTEVTEITVLEEDEPVTDGKTPTAQERDAGAR